MLCGDTYMCVEWIYGSSLVWVGFEFCSWVILLDSFGSFVGVGCSEVAVFFIFDVDISGGCDELGEEIMLSEW